MKHRLLMPALAVIILCVAVLGGYMAGRAHERGLRVTAYRNVSLRRIPGSPGDTIEIRAGVVYVNGVPSTLR